MPSQAAGREGGGQGWSVDPPPCLPRTVLATVEQLEAAVRRELESAPRGHPERRAIWDAHSRERCAIGAWRAPMQCSSQPVQNANVWPPLPHPRVTVMGGGRQKPSKVVREMPSGCFRNAVNVQNWSVLHFFSTFVSSILKKGFVTNPNQPLEFQRPSHFFRFFSEQRSSFLLQIQKLLINQVNTGWCKECPAKFVDHN